MDLDVGHPLGLARVKVDRDFIGPALHVEAFDGGR